MAWCGAGARRTWHALPPARLRRGLVLSGMEKHRGPPPYCVCRVLCAVRRLFPGQSVCAWGLNPTGSAFMAHRLVTHLPPPPPAAAVDAASREGGLSMVVAAGPFTLSGDLSYAPLVDLLAYCSGTRRDVTWQGKAVAVAGAGRWCLLLCLHPLRSLADPPAPHPHARTLVPVAVLTPTRVTRVPCRPDPSAHHRPLFGPPARPQRTRPTCCCCLALLWTSSTRWWPRAWWTGRSRRCAVRRWWAASRPGRRRGRAPPAPALSP